MSLKEQLIDDMDAKFLSDEGILGLVERISCERKVLGKINEIIYRKAKEYKRKQKLDEIQKSIKIELFETPRENIKEGEIYCLVCGANYYYVYYIKEVTDNLLPIVGFFLYSKSSQTSYFPEYRHTLDYQNFTWHKVIDQTWIENVRKQIKR